MAKQKAVEDDDFCRKCGEVVKEKGMRCDACSGWVHCICADMPDALYKVITKTKCPGVKWFCEGCEGEGRKMGFMVGGVIERQERMEEDLKEVKRLLVEKHGKMEEELKEVRKELEEIRKGGIVKEGMNFAGALKSNLTQEQLEKDKGTIGGGNSRAAEREFKVQLTEAMERDKRRKNLVLMGIPEQDEGNTEEYVKELLMEITKEEDVVFTVLGRIGKEQATKARPVRIVIEEADVKRSILKRASSLKEVKKFERVYVCPDLTRKQQEEDKKLREKVKEYRGQGMLGVKIVKGEVVREEGSERVVLYGSDH
jgi:hypothetical protein